MFTRSSAASSRSLRPVVDPDGGSFEPLNSLAGSPHRLARWRTYYSGEELVPSFVLIGPRGHGVPVRLALIAGLSVEERIGTTALAKLLVECELAPLLAQDYAVFGYPWANRKPQRGSREFSKDFWRGSTDPAVRFFEHEFEVNQFDAVVFIQGNELISGFQLRTCSRFIATEVLWPAVELAQRFLPLAPEPIRVWPCQGSQQTSIFNLGHLRPRPFCLSVCTPRHAPEENQIAAIVFGIKQILQHYRAAAGYARRL
ncbi:MAG: hypothetical protein JO069_19540 [Verrucomicrobia bacterium]|nr:hypothetical protein [Verrucomicrobiota bacterium]